MGGLCNRIKSLVSAMRYADEYGYGCGIVWPVLDSYKTRNHILNCSYSDLFNIGQVTEHYAADQQDIVYKSHCLWISDADSIPDNFNNFDSRCSVRFSANDRRGRNIDFMYNQIPDSIKETYKRYFKQIQLIPHLQRKVIEFSNAHFSQPTVSLHIRSWNRHSESGRRDLFQLDKFEREMSKQSMDVKFFLATDSQQVINYFTQQSQFKDRIITYPRKTDLDTSRDHSSGVQEDAIELFLLSKNNTLIGSHFSTYTEVAWWLAGCPKNVVII